MERFVDEVTIDVASGKGGDGCVSFRREKYVAYGGPDGGDGGKGGSVIFFVKNNLKTLYHLKIQRTFKAQSGQPGMGKKMHGKDGQDVEIPVPPGTLIKNAETGEVIKDLVNENERWVFLKGGNGGFGNVHFKNSVRQAPKFAKPGLPGEEMTLKVELSFIADLGFVGFPNAGKSSLLKVLSNANPGIGAYPFTTKIPNLGVLRRYDRDLILADIPGILEGAHDGYGLGIRFLKHIARTSALVFLVDLSDYNYLEAYDILQSELDQYSDEFKEKPRLLVATKIDMPDTDIALEELKAKYPDTNIIPISSHQMKNIDVLTQEFYRMVDKARAEEDEI